MSGIFTFSTDKPLIIKKEGPKGPFSMTRIHWLPERLSVSQAVMIRLPSIPCHRTLTKGALTIKRQKKRGAFAPLFLLASDFSVSLEDFDRESSPLTSPIAVASLTDIARLLRKAPPYGS
jgi:hypothetical protein